MVRLGRSRINHLRDRRLLAPKDTEQTIGANAQADSPEPTGDGSQGQEIATDGVPADMKKLQLVADIAGTALPPHSLTDEEIEYSTMGGEQ